MTASVDQDGSDVPVTKAGFVRTARRIMEGNVFASTIRVPWLVSQPSHAIPDSLLDEHAQAAVHIAAALAS